MAIAPPTSPEERAKAAAFFRALVPASSFLTMYLGGWAAIAAGILVGPYLAALAQMETGNLEPHLVHVDWPVFATVCTTTLPVLPAARQQWSLASLATLPMLLLPGWEIYRMYRLAGG